MADPQELFSLRQRVAIVTGASSGLGARFARVLADAGARVVLAARRREPLERLAAELPGCMAVPCDVTVDEDLARLVDVTVERYARIDVLVNNAGTTDPGRAEDIPPATFRSTVEVNLTAAFVLSQLVARPMLAAGQGSIVNVASVHGLVASAPNRQTAYAASKGGLVNLTRELAVQWARNGVRVNALAPGYFPSELTSAMLEDQRSLDWIVRNTPMGRPGRHHELDGALLYLASDASTYVTGTILPVDGGWTAR